MPQKLTAQVLTHNSERTLRRCLESLAWADELLVVDSGSGDETLAIAREFNATILERPFETYGRQQNWALEQGSHDWRLVVDSDEWLLEGAREEIQGLLTGEPPRRGYWIHRRNTYLGREICFSGWQNDRVLRLFNRTAARFSDREDDHSDALIDGEAGALAHGFGHEPYRDLADHVERIQRYSTKGAAELRARGKRVGLAGALVRPAARFLRGYLLRQGFRDGPEGLVLAVMTSVYVFLKYAKAWEEGRK